jgi:hypothetical protein
MTAPLRRPAEFRNPPARDAAWGRFLARRGARQVVVRPRTFGDIRPLSNAERRAQWAARYYLVQALELRP